MVGPDRMKKTMVKNISGFHPEQASLNKHKAQPSGAIVSEADEDSPASSDWSAVSTEELRERAKGLAFDQWDTYTREQLVAALNDFRVRQLEPRTTHH